MINTRIVITTLVAVSAAMTIPVLATDLTWTGSTDSNWDTTTENWSGDSSTFTKGANVTFDATAESTTISITGDITAGDITVSGSSGYTFFNGTDGDSVSLTAGTLTLSSESDSWSSLKIGEGVALTVSKFSRLVDQDNNSCVLNIDGSVVVNNSAQSTLSSSYVTMISQDSGANGSILFKGSLYIADGEVYLSTSAVVVESLVTASSGAKIQIGGVNGVNTTATFDSLKIAATTEENEITVAEGSTLTVTGAINDSTAYSTYGTNISGGGTLNAGSLTVSGSASGRVLTIGVANLNITGEALFSGTSATTISSTNATIGTITSSAGHTLTISDGATVTTGAFSRTDGILVLDVNGTLNVTTDSGTGLLAYGTSASFWCGKSQTLSGSGTVNAEGIQFWSNNSSSVALNITVANLNIGETGFVLSNQGQFTLSGTTVGIIDGTNSVSIATKLTLNDGITTFNPTSGKTMAISGVLSGTGTLAKTGEGTLMLSGENTYTGGTTISEGVVSVEASSALGSSAVTIDGGQLVISGTGVTVTNNISVVLDSYIANTELALAADGDVTTTVYAIVLDDEGSLDDGVTISVSATSTFMNSLETDETYKFAIVYGDFNGEFDWSALEDAGYTVTSDSGVITVTTPEPSMFGLLAGLGAIGLVATRRCRNRKA